ncbi:unnamed protein product [Hymenolepis diminuta]|uniref:Reverse transcriptase domain-containing protein n=1 Tax=Hymenolepis diminuta TaxID=6216 RepID=A0A564XUR7_HYMDI|nr:unnamed protein product [Hymenolepis diminuta]VUZ38717.1 unnamed protein product [Hymenolepis diminuta]
MPLFTTPQSIPHSVGKQRSPAVAVKPVSGYSDNHLFLQDRSSSTSLIIYSRMRIFVLPSTPTDQTFSDHPFIIAAANGSPIKLLLDLSRKKLLDPLASLWRLPHTQFYHSPRQLPHIRYTNFPSTPQNKKIFSKIGLVCSNDHISVAEADIFKTVNATAFGLFEFLRMTFGLLNAAQTFQRFNNEVLNGLDFVVAHIDDILVAIENKKKHKKYLEIVFE